MKKAIIIITIVAIAVGAFFIVRHVNKPEIPPPHVYKRKWPADQVYDTKKYYKWVKGALCYREVFEYDAQGRQIEKKRVKPDGTIIRRYTFQHDNRGNVVEWKIYDADNVLNYTVTYQYDANGNEIGKKIMVSDGTLIAKNDSIYKDKENITLDTTNKSVISLDYKSSYLYDRYNNKVEENIFYENGTLFLSNAWAYNEKNLRTEEINYNSKKGVISKLVCSYDASGRKIEEKSYNASGVFRIYKYQYNERGQLIATSHHYPSGTLIKKYVYTYDNAGRKISELTMKSNDTPEEKMTFNYDQQGNLIEDITYTVIGKMYSRNTYKYKGKIKIEEKNFDANNNLLTRTTYNYDSKGNETEVTTYNAKGELVQKFLYSYSYDIKGNAIKKNTYSTDKAPK